MKPVRTAVIPVAGLGTRLLPATKSIPKELVPIVDRPLIQYVVEEAAAAGLTRIVLVTRSGKEAIENHFDRHFELEQQLQQKGKDDLLAAVRGALPAGVEILSVRQPRAAGLGDAIRCAGQAVGDEPFAVLLPDVLTGTPRQAARSLGQLLNSFELSGRTQILVERVSAEEVEQYGIVDCGGQLPKSGASVEIRDLVEKPRRGSEPSRLAIVGRYVLSNRIFKILESTGPGAGGEIQLTDALRALRRESGLRAVLMPGRSFDCGNKLGYAKACFSFAMQDASIAEAFSEYAFAELDRSGGLAGLRQVA